MRRAHGALALGASLGGTGISTLAQLIFIPIFIKLLGFEAYGLIGFYLAVAGAAQVMDLGLSPALSRELAGLDSHPHAAAPTRDLVRTVEVGYLLLGVVLGAALTGLAPWLGRYWFQGAGLPNETIVQALQAMGLLLVVQWPISLYQSGLVGLEQQVGLNVINTGATILANAGGALLLWWVSPTLITLLVWLIVVNAVRTAALAILLWRNLPAADRGPRIDLSRLRAIAPYAAGMAVGSAAGLLLTQLDRVAVSWYLPLADLGRYTLAANVVTALGLLAVATYNVLFPRLASLVEAGSNDALTDQFHLTAQIVAVIVVPSSCVLSLFAPDVFTLWVGDAAAAAAVAPAAALLASGSLLNALAIAPYALQLAARWTRLNAFLSLGLLAIAVPLWLWLPGVAGLAGAAAVWVIINLMGFTVHATATFSRLLRTERKRWFWEDVTLPVSATVIAAGVVRLAADLWLPDRSGLTAFLLVALAAVVATGAALATAPRTRNNLSALLRTLRAA